MDSDLILKRIEQHLDETLLAWKNDLGQLISLKSVRDPVTADTNAPFGMGIRDTFDVFGQIAYRLGFKVNDYAGYAMDAELPAAKQGATQDYIAILGHLDVVPADDQVGWLSDPFTLSEREGYLYGRGVNDDKGPLLLCLYAAYLLNKINFEFKFPLRIIAGGAEETTWECVDYYFRHNAQPLAAFSPDGNFPIVNHELGILDIVLDFPALDHVDIDSGVSTENPRQRKSTDGCCIYKISSPNPEHKVCSEVELILLADGKQLEPIVFTGKSALSRNPERGENAIDMMMDFLNEKQLHSTGNSEFKKSERNIDEPTLIKFYRKLFCVLTNIKTKTNQFTFSATSIDYSSNSAKIYLDIRYPKDFDIESVVEKLEADLSFVGASFCIDRHLKPLYVDEKSPLIEALSRSYKKVIGMSIGKVQSKGAASYARALDNGVNFGPTFPNEEPGSHFPNECFSLDSAKKLLKIYALSIAELNEYKENIENR